MCTDIELEDLLEVPVVVLQEIQRRLDEARERIAARETPDDD